MAALPRQETVLQAESLRPPWRSPRRDGPGRAIAGGSEVDAARSLAGRPRDQLGNAGP